MTTIPRTPSYHFPLINSLGRGGGGVLGTTGLSKIKHRNGNVYGKFRNNRTDKEYRERVSNGLFITLVLKVFNNVFLFVGLTTSGTLVNFDWLAH